jgi:predicted ABC-type ATPase
VPRLIILAGPNGAGKTTFSREFLTHEAACKQFINADLIAAGISPYAPETADVTAGRVTLARFDELSAQGADLAIETTLSGRWLLDRVRRVRADGYRVELFYLRIETPEIAIRRVAQRVSEGGHFIPENVVRRRFSRSLELLESYKNEVDYWNVYNNTGLEPVFEASGVRDT